MKEARTFFDFAAEVGLTKHLGGLNSTDELVQLCHINEDSYVLDVGCGAGVTPCYLAQRYRCKVIGVDILERMIERSKERAERENLTDLVDFRPADAQDLPFEENTFDAVITESVTAFPEDKRKAVQEYARVAKPGGFVGLNEATWLKSPQTPEITAWVSQEVGASVKPLTADEWKGLLESAGLVEVTERINNLDIKGESRGIIQRYGCGGIIASLFRGLQLYFRNPLYREFVKRVRGEGITPDNLDKYFGYGIYVGMKKS